MGKLSKVAFYFAIFAACSFSKLAFSDYASASNPAIQELHKK